MKNLFKKINSLKAAFLVGLFLATAAYSQPAHDHYQTRGGPDSPPGPPQGRFLDRLDLSEQQKEQVMTLMEYHHEQMETYREKIREIHEDLKELLTDPEDPQAIKLRIMDMAQLEGEMKSLRVDLIFDIMELLTEDQLDKLPDNFLMRFLQPQGPQQHQPPQHHDHRPPQDHNHRPNF
ncbi:MAG: Spy/CpxP family protein refolding chaperone [bacterium]